jgi:hypothetical protein
LPVLAAAVSVERRRAVGADDAEILEPVVVRHAVDVIEDQGERATVPELALTAELAPWRLDALGEQTPLQVAAVVRRVLDEELGEGSGDSTQGLPPDRVLVEVRDADSPALDVLPDGEVVAPGGTQPDLAKRLAVGTRRRDGVPKLGLRETNTPRHEHMFA